MVSDSVGFTRAKAYQGVMIIYAITSLLPLIIFGSLSSVVEASGGRVKAGPVANFLGLHQSRNIVLGLSCLFVMDAFAGGFTLQSMYVPPPPPICAFLHSLSFTLD